MVRNKCNTPGIIKYPFMARQKNNIALEFLDIRNTNLKK